MRQRLGAYCAQRVYLLLGIAFLLLSVTMTARAILTVSSGGLSGDADVTVDGTGTLNLGTASSTAVLIGQAGIPVTIPDSLAVNGTLTLGAASTSAGQLILMNASSSFTTLLQASSSQASNLIFTLPPTAGTAGQAMLTDGTGTLYFGSSGSSQWVSGDNGSISYNDGNVTMSATVLLGTSLTGLSDAGPTINAALAANGTVIVPDGDLAIATKVDVPPGKSLQFGAGTITCTTWPCITYQSGSRISGRGAGATVINNTMPAGIANPGAPGVVATCSGTCTTAYPYVVVAYNAKGHTARSAAASVNNAATLDGTHYNTVTTPAVAGSTGCDVWRTAPFAVHGKITATPVACGAAVVDNGLTSDLTTAYTINSTAGQVIGPYAYGTPYTDVEIRDLEVDEASRRAGSVGVDSVALTNSNIYHVAAVTFDTGIEVSESHLTTMYNPRAESCNVGINYDWNSYENSLYTPYAKSNLVYGVQSSGGDSLSLYTYQGVQNAIDIYSRSDGGNVRLYGPRFENCTTAGFWQENGGGRSWIYSPFLGGTCPAITNGSSDVGKLVSVIGSTGISNLEVGTVSAPSLAWSDVGIYRSGTGRLGFVSGGSDVGSFTATESVLAGGDLKSVLNSGVIDIAVWNSGVGWQTAFSIPRKGGAVPTLATCGTSPALAGNNVQGTITVGTTTTGCTLSFTASTWAATPICTLSFRGGTAIPYAVSTSAITLTASGDISGAVVDYRCTQ